MSGGGGRAPVLQAITVADTAVTAHSTPFTITSTLEAGVADPKPLPEMVSVVPPRELPTLGLTDVTEIVDAVPYWKGVATGAVGFTVDELENVALADRGLTVTVTGQEPLVSQKAAHEPPQGRT